MSPSFAVNVRKRSGLCRLVRRRSRPWTPRTRWNWSQVHASQVFREVTRRAPGSARLDPVFRQHRHSDLNARAVTGLRFDLDRAEDLLATLTHAGQAKAA